MKLRANQGFTLVEIVIALTILIIIAAVTIPTFKGLRNEQVAREPIEELTRLAKEARLRAMREKRPYQIAFHSSGFTASRYLTPYMQLTQLNEFLAQTEQEAQEPASAEEIAEDAQAYKSGAASAPEIVTKSNEPKTRFAEWTENYTLPSNTHYTVKYWHEVEETPIEGEFVKLWVFQPSGICQPIKIHLERESASFSVEYGALTADIIKESSDVK